MPFDWKEFLELARNLAGQTGTGYSKEAADRTSVSRAYYAAFCYARNYAEKHLGFKPQRTAADHQRLKNHFIGLGGVWADRGEDLDDLRKWRNQCDYDNLVHGLQELVANALDSASKIFAECR